MFSAFEVDPDSIVARFTEGLRLMKACWTEPRITFCMSGLCEVAEAGAELIQLHLLIDEVEQMERLATEVIFDM